MQCPILDRAEIEKEECLAICTEANKEKNGKKLPKKIKRIIGWKGICKACKYHIEEK